MSRVTISQLYKLLDAREREIRARDNRVKVLQACNEVIEKRLEEMKGRHEYRVAEYKKLEEKCKVLEHDNLRERQRVEALLYALQCVHGEARRTGLKHGVGVAAATEAGFGFVTRADGSCGWEKIAKDGLAMAAGPEGEE